MSIVAYAGKPHIDLRGQDGNAFFLMSQASHFSRQLNLDAKPILVEMLSGGYDNLVNTFDKYFGDVVDIVR